MKRYYYSAYQKILEHIYPDCPNLTKIYMFHQINEGNKIGVEESFWISSVSFENFVLELIKKDYPFCKASELLNRYHDNCVCLTLDDAFYDAVETASDILGKYRIPFTVFISDTFIDKPGYITKKQIANLSSNLLCEVGFHTKSHTVLRFIEPKKLNEEFLVNELEILTEKAIKTIAFPYGSVYACGKREYECAKKAGYSLIFTTIYAPLTNKWINKFGNVMPRINVNESNYRLVLNKA